MEEKPKKHQTRSYANRLLKALAEILESPDASIPEKIQAAKISHEALERRPIPRRKTEIERLRAEALKKTLNKPKGRFGKPKKNPPPEGEGE
jgi:hypothetical protein